MKVFCRLLRCRKPFVQLLHAGFALLLVSSIASGKDNTYQPPRLADGHPNLQGSWDHTDATPLVRPAGVKTLVISAEQAREIERAIESVTEDRSSPTEPTDYFNKRSIQPIRGEYRSSIVVDPEDGVLPGTPLFKQWLGKVRFDQLNAMDGPEQRPTSERCLGNPASQPPNLFNPGTNLHQIVQAGDTIVFLAEVMHEARIIRMNATHVPAAVTSWLGDSIGWWEGDTLVVETKHFSPSDTGRVAAWASFRVSPQATVTERITRVSANELNYSFTVDDPVNYTRPWKGETHFMRSDDQLLEYACHEGNTTIRFLLQGARMRDEQAQAPVTASPATSARASGLPGP